MSPQDDRWTKAKAAQTALEIVNGGACNLTAIARALHEIGRAYIQDGGDAANQSAPMRLALTQVNYLAFGPRANDILEPMEMIKLIEECEAIVSMADMIKNAELAEEPEAMEDQS